MGVGFGQKLDASRGGQLLERVEHLRREGAELLDGDAVIENEQRNLPLFSLINFSSRAFMGR